MNADLHELTAELLRELKRLRPEQGRVARANARKAVRAVLRRLRARLDAEFPPVPRTAPRPRRKRTPAERQKRLEERGYAPCHDVSDFTTFAEVGVRLVRVRNGAFVTSYAPTWALQARREGGRSRVLRARKSKLEQRALRTVWELQHGPKGPFGL